MYPTDDREIAIPLSHGTVWTTDEGEALARDFHVDVLLFSQHFFGFAPFSALKFVMKECMYYCIALIRKLWMIMIEWSSESEFVITLVYFPVSLTPYGVSY